MSSSAARNARRTAERDGSFAFRQWVAAELARIAPPGWGTRKVDPWKTDPDACRVCSTPIDTFSVAMLTRMLPGEKIVLYTFAAVCSGCVASHDKLSALGKRVLATEPEAKA